MSGDIQDARDIPDRVQHGEYGLDEGDEELAQKRDNRRLVLANQLVDERNELL